MARDNPGDLTGFHLPKILRKNGIKIAEKLF